MRGQTLIETLVALAIGVVVVSAITVVSISTLSSAQYVRYQENATKFAEEGMEVMRRIRNSNYAAFRLYTGTYCLDEGSVTIPGSANGPCTTENIGNVFVRSVEIVPNGCGTSTSNISRVTVIVAYRTGKCAAGKFCHSSKQISCLSTVNPVAAP